MKILGDAWEAVMDEGIWDPDQRADVFLQACVRYPLVLDAEGIIREALESQEHHESAGDQVPEEGLIALQAFMVRWNEKYGRSVETWMPNESERVAISPSWWTEFDLESGDTDA